MQELASPPPVRNAGYVVTDDFGWIAQQDVAGSVPAFVALWDNMPIDQYIKGNHKYRRRRFSEYHLSANDDLVILPPRSFTQSGEVNRLFGDVQRRFEPLEDLGQQSVVLREMIAWSAASMRRHFDAPHGDWRIGIHFIRIEAAEDASGIPTPEGVHRDGHRYVAMFLINRQNVVGGFSEIYDHTGSEKLLSTCLQKPFEAVLVDDAVVQHAATPIERSVVGKSGYRDMCLVTFDPYELEHKSEAAAPLPNILMSMRAKALGYAQRLASKPETAGVILLGGQARTGERRYIDVLSDLDFCLLLDLPQIPKEVLALDFPEFSEAVQPFLPGWLPNFKFRVHSKTTGLPGPFDVDVHQMILQYEMWNGAWRAWPIDKVEAFAETGEVIYDRSGEVGDLLKAKCGDIEHRSRTQLIATLASVPVRLSVDVEKCVQRRLFADAHLVITAAVIDLVRGLYLAAGHLPPNNKWMVHELTRTNTADRAKLEAEVGAALLVEHLTAEDVGRRKALAFSLLERLLAAYRAGGASVADPYEYASTTLFPDRQLAKKTRADREHGHNRLYDDRMTVVEWGRLNWLVP